MAIEYKRINDELKNAPLNEEELALIKDAESYIDSIILKDFKGGDVRVILSCPDFDYNHIKKEHIDLPHYRKEKMRNELDLIYKNAGWRITLDLDDGLDGPNMSGADYWVLRGKNR